MIQACPVVPLIPSLLSTGKHKCLSESGNAVARGYFSRSLPRAFPISVQRHRESLLPKGYSSPNQREKLQHLKADVAQHGRSEMNDIDSIVRNHFGLAADTMDIAANLDFIENNAIGFSEECTRTG